ncbi:MAG: hypothetical protein A4S09_13640 [Proteobacteria bacterium SG_bin7]|nr:MAG: hypothetical protein A4S09_13640 [Proteobacteria bacterium SG_bin7]
MRKLLRTFLSFTLVASSVSAQTDTDEAFSNLENFSHSDSIEATSEFLAPLDNSSVALDEVENTDVERAEKELGYISEEHLEKPETSINGVFISLALLGGGQKALENLMTNLYRQLAVKGELENVKILFNSSPIPEIQVRVVNLHKEEYDRQEASLKLQYSGVKLDIELAKFEYLLKRSPVNETRIAVTSGALAFVKNVDELAALFAKGLAKVNPRVLGFSDDPNFYRNIENIAALSNAGSKAQEIAKIDLSVIERLMAAGFNPWALTEFERRVHDWIENEFGQRKYLLSQDAVQNIKQLPGEYRSLRLQIQKDYLAYLSKKKDILDLVSRHQNFPKELDRLRTRIKLFVYPLYVNLLKWSIPVVGAIAFSYLPIYEAAMASIQATSDYVVTSNSFQSFRSFIEPALDLTAPLRSYAADHMVFLSAIGAGALTYKFFGPPPSEIVPVSVKFAKYTRQTTKDLASSVGTIGTSLYNNTGYLYASAWSGTQYVSKLLWQHMHALVAGTGNLARQTVQGIPGAIVNVGKFGLHIGGQTLLLGKRLTLFTYNKGHTGILSITRGTQKLVDSANVRLQKMRDQKSDFEKLRAFLANPETNPKEIFPFLKQAIYLANLKFLPRAYRSKAHPPATSTLPNLVATSGVALDYVKRLWDILDDLVEKDLVPKEDLRSFNNSSEAADFVRNHGLNPSLHGLFVKYYETLNKKNILQFESLLSHSDSYYLGFLYSTLLNAAPQTPEEAFKVIKLIVDKKPEIQKTAVFKIFLREHSHDILRWLLSKSISHRDLVDFFKVLKNDSEIHLVANYTFGAKKLTSEEEAKFFAFLKDDKKSVRGFGGLRDLKLTIPRNWLKNAGSITELTAYIDENFKNDVLRSYQEELFYGIIKRPELFKTKEDILLFLNRDYYWRELYINTPYYSPAEVGFVPYINQLKHRYQNIWRYKQVDSELTHDLITKRLQALGQYPSTFEGRLELFLLLTSRGVSLTTDLILQDLLQNANEMQEKELSKLALTDGRAFDRSIFEEFAARQFLKSEVYQTLVTYNNETPNDRKPLLLATIEKLQENFPEGGIRYVSILEDLSVKILSTQEESKIIHDAKFWPKATNTSEQKIDPTFSAMYNLIKVVTKWKKEDQFAFLLFLRGDDNPTQKIHRAFLNLGPFRIRRTYQNLPIWARSTIVEMLLEEGILRNESLEKGVGKKIIDNLISHGDKDTQKAAREILSAFLYALGKLSDGNDGFQKKILGYLYALPRDKDATIGHTLKQILEVFGATGIKVGQFLVAADLIPAATPILRELQERADIPNREDIYADAREILGTDKLPFTLRQLLGAASLKYAYLATDSKSQQDIVIKIFRASAVNHVRTELVLLDSMAEYLNKRGYRYGIFKTIVDAARRAVEKELEITEESKKSARAKNFIYIDLSDEKIKIQVPKEQLIKDRMLVSEYARGGSFNDLPEYLRKIAAKKISEIESKILFGDSDTIEFDPDRHAGNYRIYFQTYHGRDHMVLEPMKTDSETREIYPIDFGQLIKMKKDDRQKIIKLFALSQIITQLGPNEWTAQEITHIFSLNSEQAKLLGKKLRRYFPEPEFKDKVTAYFALLSAVKDAGFKTFDISYVDFIRAIIQLQQYEAYLDDKSVSPKTKFTEQVIAEAEKYKATMKLSLKQKIMVSSFEMWNRLTTGKSNTCKKLF